MVVSEGEPVVELMEEGIGVGELGEALCPGLEGSSFRGEVDSLVMGELQVGGKEVMEEDGPGDGVDGEVVDSDKEEVGVVGVELEVGEADEGAVGDIEGSLEVSGGSLDAGREFGIGGRGEVEAVEGDVIVGRGVELVPAVGGRVEAEAEGVVVGEEVGEGGAEEGRVEGEGEVEEEALVPVVWVREVLGEEPVLDGGKGDGALDRELVGDGGVGGGSEGSEGSDGGGLEELFGGKV